MGGFKSGRGSDKGDAGAATSSSSGASSITQNQRAGTFIITMGGGHSIAAQAAHVITVSNTEVAADDTISVSCGGQSANVPISAACIAVSAGSAFKVMLKNENGSGGAAAAAASTFRISWAIV
tara:strand:- start:221 stop:589 length:369 start_codon:yes stop_codon:yes gene_type:complete